MASISTAQLSPMELGKVNKCLAKQYRFEGGQVMTLRQWIESAPIVGKHEDTQTHTAHKVNLEYRELAQPKVFYCLNLPDGTSLPVPKCVWDCVTIEQSAVKPYTYAEHVKALEAKLAGSGVRWLIDAGWANWEEAYTWLESASMSDILAFSAVVDSESWDGRTPCNKAN